MSCGCKKRMADMKASESKVARATAKVIEPAHNAAMKVADRWEARRRMLRAARVSGKPIPPSEN